MRLVPTLKPSVRSIAVLVAPKYGLCAATQNVVLNHPMTMRPAQDAWLTRGRSHRPFRQNWRHAGQPE
jgi:hypothetical protein